MKQTRVVIKENEVGLAEISITDWNLKISAMLTITEVKTIVNDLTNYLKVVEKRYKNRGIK